MAIAVQRIRQKISECYEMISKIVSVFQTIVFEVCSQESKVKAN